MHKIYKLLRNNQQSGPYTIDELLQLSLKPQDLIWAEGQSVGWSYPSEIPTLKEHFLPSKEKETANKKSDEVSSAVPTNTKATSIKSSARHIHVVLPMGSKTMSVVSQVSSPEEESPEEKLKKKAEALYQRVQLFAQQKEMPQPDEELHIKYNRSLDDIKQEYSDWMQEQKGKSKPIDKKLLVPAVLILFVGIAGFIAGHILSLEKTVALTQSDETAPVNKSVGAVGNKASDLTSPATTFNKKETSKTKTSKPAVSKLYNRTTSQGDITASTKKQQANTQKEQSSKNPIDKKETPVPTNSTRQPQKQPPVVNTTDKEEENVSLAQLITISEKSTGGSTKGISDVQLTVYNHSNRFVNTVAVDVFYYNRNDRLLHKETLYFNNISPKSFVRLPAPENRRAASFRYQLGLISSEGTLYFAKN